MRGSCKSRLTQLRRQRECGAVPGDAPQAGKKQKERTQRAVVFLVPEVRKLKAVWDPWLDWQSGLRPEAFVARRDLMAGRPLQERPLSEEEAAEPRIAASKAVTGAQKQQMVRPQAMGTITSWLGSHDTRDAIQT